MKITENKLVLEMSGTRWDSLCWKRHKVLLYRKIKGIVDVNYLGHFNKKNTGQ
jgi:hypothetical protein